MRLTTVGTGTAAPSPARVQAGYLVAHEDLRLLLDCGSGVVFRMAQARIDWSAITHVAITHFHADHIADLATLCIAWRYGRTPPRSAPVQFIGPRGFGQQVQRLEAAFGHAFGELGYPFDVDELDAGGALDLGAGMRLRARKVPHNEESVAYSVEAAGRRLVYTGDMGLDLEVGAWARGADVLLCECSLPEDMAVAGHLTPRQCGRLAAAAQPALLALTHFYPPVEQADIRGGIAEHFDGEVALATDGWSIEI